MRFGVAQKIRFGANDGAYSVVTEREHFDSQITLTDYEADILINFFGHGNIHTGNVRDNPGLASKSFCLYQEGSAHDVVRINLNVVFPKPNKSELRLYLSAKAGFKPDGGSIWFIFVRDGNVWIGAMSEMGWRGALLESIRDDADSIYQESINEIRLAKVGGRDTYLRDRNIALQSMVNANYSCEYDSSHYLFNSRFTGKKYLEAHHLIPMGVQKEFARSLDNVNNVFCLCPCCHRAVHHAEGRVAREILGTLASKRDVLGMFGLSIDDLFSLYAIEEID